MKTKKKYVFHNCPHKNPFFPTILFLVLNILFSENENCLSSAKNHMNDESKCKSLRGVRSLIRKIDSLFLSIKNFFHLFGMFFVLFCFFFDLFLLRLLAGVQEKE